MTTTLLTGGVIHGHPAATALAIAEGTVVWVGDADGAAAYDGADERVELGGALVAPAFVDHHVHTVRTGFALSGLDVGPARTLAEALDLVAAHAAAHPGVILGQGWDETDWPEQRPPLAAELERAAPGRLTCLTRVDGHSSVVSPALSELVPGLGDHAGWTPDGRVERDAHHAVRNLLETLIGDDERLEAARGACRAMAAQGIVGFHENAAPHIGPETEIPLVRQAAAEIGLTPTVYWGELMALDTARRLGVAGLAGDLVADGAFGSRTAALSMPYADHAQTGDQTCGHGYVTAEQVRDHVITCTDAGLQAGFHVIGDAALEEVATGFELAEATLGTRIDAGHRLEHVEMPSARVIEILARCGIIASVQPMFDALWGGPSAMYAARLGDRWRATNPFAALAAAGVRLAFGSDSPVTSLGPWAAVRAAVQHRNPEHAIPAGTAFRAHAPGELAVGAAVDLAVWHCPAGLTEDSLPVLDAGAPLPALARLIARGRTVREGVAA